jgi:DNA-binding CsgD family transcriptional regulator
MSAPTPTVPAPAFQLDALNDKEREILRLLAAGHTVKSIAAGLDRSEASINERLREARRKTGVGSSRELARLLAEQKIWDRKIDLSEAASSPETPAVPPHQRGRWLKGTMMMLLIALPLAAAGLLATGTNLAERGAPSSAETSAAVSPLAGRWSLDVARIPAEERPVAVTITFEPVAGGRWHTEVMIETGDGAMRKAVSTAALDGVAVPVTGSMAEIDSVSLRQPEAGTLVMTLGKDGKRVSTRVYTVAKDGRSMTETIAWAADGMPDIVTTTFNRIR